MRPEGSCRLELVNISKTYPDGAVAADNVNLVVDEGQMVVLLGPSGCGKTTLLRLVSGLESPTGGAIVLGGEDITRWEPRRRDVAMVFQNYALYPHMTVRQNLEFGLKSRRVRADEREHLVRWAADILGLSDYLNRRPGQLSGGQRQRVALGRAIVRKPRLYLFDEPLSNLDTELRMRMRGEILSLHRRLNGTSIYVTHDQVEAMSLADKIFIMKDGKIVSAGSPKELYENPPDLFTASFLGFPPMNMLQGSVIGDDQFVSSGGLELELSPGLNQRQASPNQVVLGIRPEDLAVADDGQLAGEVVSVENLGRSVLLLVRTSSDDMLKVLGHGNFCIGEKIKARVAADKVHLFDKATGRRIV